MGKSIKQKALEHYDRMISCAEKLIPNMTDYLRMEFLIHESWFGDNCPYCTVYQINECENCPLTVDEYDDLSANCCDGLWLSMSKSRTWTTWIKRAKLVRQYVEEHG